MTLGPRLARLRRRLGATRALAGFGAIYLASQATIGAILHPMGPAKFLRAQTTFSRETYLALTAEWERAGLLGRYWAHFWLDFVHPAWYACLLAGLLARGLDRRGLGPRANPLLALPFLAGAMDLIENTVHVHLLSRRPDVSQAAITVGALACNAKWLLAGGSLALAIGLALAPRRAGGAS